MKKLLLLGFLATGLVAQAQMTQLEISVQADQLPNIDCALNQGAVPNNKVYFHSGLCTSGATLCRDSIAASGSPVWQHVVGNWGLDDGVGLMSYQGNNRFTITLVVENYYTQNISGGSTPMPNGSTPYSLGLVLRSFDGGYEGKDELCGDIYIVDIQTTPVVRSGSGNIAVPGVSVTKTILAGVSDPSYLDAMRISPNPSVDRVVVDYQLRKPAQDMHVRILNSAGQEVARLHDGKQQPGQHRFIWNGEQAAAGLYFFVMQDGDHLIANEKLLLTK